MERVVRIARAFFSAYRVDGTRQLEYLRVAVFGALPIIVAAALAFRFPPPSAGAVQLIAAIIAVLSAVLLGLLPLTHHVLGQADTRREYEAGEALLARQELNRIRTLQDLHAAISWTVILLVVGLGCCLILAVAGSEPAEGLEAGASPPLPEWRRWLLIASAVVLYYSLTVTALAFFDIATGVFTGMESYAESIKERISANIRREDERDERDE